MQGKVILITGASSGIGLATAKRLAGEGARIIGVARDEKRLQDALAALGRGHAAQTLDVAQLDSFADFVAGIPEIDGVVHAAGETDHLPLRNVKKADLERVMTPHLYAPLLLTTELLRARKLKHGGSVVFISSTAAEGADRGLGLYGLAKSGLQTLAKSLTAEYLAQTKIRFNCVVPGLVETAMVEDLSRVLGADGVEKLKQKFPIGIGQPQDVAALIRFLLSDESHWISGASYLIDGGHVCAN